MTAIIALENKKKDDVYIVSADDLVGEDSMGLEVGEKLSLEELMYGMMLHSGNDAAEVLANNFPSGRAAFVKAMNNKAKALGLTDTNFTNPTGLEGDGNQYTTAYDLVVTSEYALSNFPLFAQAVSTFDYNIVQTTTHKAFYLENETNLLTSYPGVKGVKTGYTPEAGFCLVTYLDFGGHKIIGVILNSENRRDDMKELLDYSLKTLGVTPPHHG
jgi:D-alanyl-D-alanine carboxypeptidase (penicillin-binding protein 5/6)